MDAFAGFTPAVHAEQGRRYRQHHHAQNYCRCQIHTANIAKEEEGRKTFPISNHQTNNAI